MVKCNVFHNLSRIRYLNKINYKQMLPKRALETSGEVTNHNSNERNHGLND